MRIVLPLYCTKSRSSPPLDKSVNMYASILSVFFFETTMVFIQVRFESIISYSKLSLMNLNTLYQTDDDSMMHQAFLGMQTNSLCMDMTTFFIFLLCRTFPLGSWISTCRVFLCRSITTYVDGLHLVFVCCLDFFFEPDALFMTLLCFREIFLFWLALFLRSPCRTVRDKAPRQDIT